MDEALNRLFISDLRRSRSFTRFVRFDPDPVFRFTGFAEQSFQ
ncbi:hypothetical protein [Rhizobium leguminosarum]